MKTKLDFKIVTKKEYKAIGLELSGPYSELQKMPMLWENFVKKIPEIPHPVNPELQVSLGITNDRPDDFTYYAAIEVSEFEIPEGMKGITVPEQTYAVFTHKGPASRIGETINGARTTLLSEGYKLDPNAFWFEYYDKRHNPLSEDSELDLYFTIISQ